jgi:hypothetical protein
VFAPNREAAGATFRKSAIHRVQAGCGTDRLEVRLSSVEDSGA